MTTKRSILIINPNSTEGMTEALKPLVHGLSYNETEYAFFTPPSGPKSIDNEDDADESTKHCLPYLKPLLEQYHGFVVACYSFHPLVPALKEQDVIRREKKVVTGIFESSIGFSLLAMEREKRFGIVTAGKSWEEVLTKAVSNFLGSGLQRFAGVESTGLKAVELHDAPAEEVKTRMLQATKRLVKRENVGAICLGCAGMAGMNETVRQGCVEELGEHEGRAVVIVDGVQAGIGFIENALRIGL
ncbi:MAG: hypothetical protein M1821_006282 [Bathelium mastoideum]|nr:MAG: hypothetical protein M1821_006282 [Bathelium mastoideum]KAI9686622.1 MAG: hypothetical protein M1822_003633 [Bathelium mastoideum]